jgi:hypothetical protein
MGLTGGIADPFMRWDNQNVPNSVQQSEIQLLTEKIAQLEKRVAELEKRFVEPSDNSGAIDLADARYRLSSDGVSAPVESVETPSKRGRPPLVPRDQLAWRRDELINFIEVRWPDLLRHMKRPKSIDDLLEAIKNASPGAQTNWPYLHLKENVGKLWKFLSSDRYTGEPRQIAYAMAGVPDMEWRSSLNACTKCPSRLPIALPAFKDHIHRHNRALLRSLVATGPTEANLRRLAKHCGECRRLAAEPKLVCEALEQGEQLVDQPA